VGGAGIRTGERGQLGVKITKEKNPIVRGNQKDRIQTRGGGAIIGKKLGELGKMQLSGPAAKVSKILLGISTLRKERVNSHLKNSCHKKTLDKVKGTITFEGCPYSYKVDSNSPTDRTPPPEWKEKRDQSIVGAGHDDTQRSMTRGRATWTKYLGVNLHEKHRWVQCHQGLPKILRGGKKSAGKKANVKN